METIEYVSPDPLWHEWANRRIRQDLDRKNAPELDWEDDPIPVSVDWRYVTVGGL